MSVPASSRKPGSSPAIQYLPGAVDLAVELQLVAVHALADPRHGDARDRPAGTLTFSRVPVGSGIRPSAPPSAAASSPTSAAAKSAAAVKSKPSPKRWSYLAPGGLLGDGEAREAEDQAFDRGGHGPRVGDVVAEVRAVVDAGDHDLGPEAVHEAQVRQADAVDRRPVGGVADGAVAERDLGDEQRAAGRDHPREGRAVAVRGDDDEVDAVDAQQRAPQGLQALRLDAVVVREQDPHAHPRG